MPNFTKWHLTLPWVPEVFFPVVCGENWATKLPSWRAGKKPLSGHGSYEPHFWNKITRQTGFFVGSVRFRNWTCLHEGQWCVKRRVMQWNWGMANFVSGVSITPVKRLTSVNSVYSVNNFCRVWNVNLLYNIWIWKVQLIRRCPFERAKYSAKLSSVLGFSVNKESTASSVLCVKCRRELDKFEKFFEGLSVFK